MHAKPVSPEIEKRAAAAADHALRQSEAHKDAILRAALDAIMIMDHEGSLVEFNHAAETIFGWKAEDVIGKPLVDLIIPERLRKLHKHGLVHYLATGEGPVLNNRVELPALRADGTEFPAELAIVPIPGSEPVMFTAFLRDITKYRQTEGALRDNERRFREMIDALPVAIYTTDAEGLLTHFNPACVDLSGRVPQLGTDRWCVNWMLYHADGTPMPHDQCPMAIALKEGRIVRGVEALAERPDGTRVWFAPYPTPLRDATGRIVGGINMLIDITARKVAEEAMARLAAIVQSSDDAIIGKNLDGIITSWNAGAERLFGYTAAEVIGRSVTVFIPPERIAEETKIIGHIRRGEPVEHFETVRRRKDGTLLDVSLTVSPIVDSAGRIVGASKIARDITEHKQAQRSLLARAEELARADRSKDEFLAMLAHELRNPLAPLRNAAEILKGADISEDEREKAQHILGRSIENMGRMIDDLLDVSRINEGKIQLRKQPVALEVILTAAASLARSNCAAHSQELVLSLPAEPVFLNADATRLEQVFGNLLNNACKYSGDGSHIALSAERVEGTEPPEVIVRVRDDGIGIDPELLPHIFDLFVQASRTLDRAHGGLGIGLTLVQRLVTLHDGSVQARSHGLGHGAEFIVRLPILRETPPPPAPTPHLAPETPRRILIVDDNTDSARSLAMLQKRRGHETRTAFTGPDAITTAADFLPEVVLLDIGLPGMDGFEVAREIRAMPTLTGVLLIAMSGYGREEDREEARLAGFDEYLVKPVDLDRLQKWLRGRG